jgi:glycosyltransferase involved in cell wall biosynthesis
MKILFFAGRMPDLCGAFLHDIDLGIELQKRGHDVVFMSLEVPKEGVNGGTYRSFRFMHYTANSTILDSSQVWICPHAPALPEVRKINARGYNRPIIATCHFDGNYRAIVQNNPGRTVKWVEMLMFVNSIMEINYRNAVVPWPPNVVRTAMVRPILHESKIAITEPFQGEHITLVNANHNKGILQFIALADAMSDRKFLGVSAYYGGYADQKLAIPRPKHNNVTWVPFNDDIREILKQTRILLMPSYYESFGRIGIEAMYNGIPVLYSKPAANPSSSNGSSEGLHEWIQPVGIPCEREVLSDWISAVQSLDDETAYATKSEESKHHIQSMNLFTEASRIADMVEVFTREHPVQIRVSQPLKQSQMNDQPLKEMSAARIPEGSALGFSSGRLRIRR